MNIAGIEIGPGHPCRTVAEISCNHGGDFDRAIRLIAAAKEAGADFVKFQCYTPDELVALRGDGSAPEPWGSQGWTMRSLYEKAATPLEWFPGLFAHARAIGIVPFSSVFGLESLKVLEACDCPAYKIAAIDNRDLSLRALVNQTGKPVIVSDSRMNQGTFTLYCPPGYPQSHWRVGGAFDCGDAGAPPFEGFSYHGTDPLPCVVAATLGAQLIEAHFQLDDEPSELEAAVSLTASQFAAMVESIRKTEAVLA